MGRTAFRMLALLGLFGTALAGSYQPFSFLTSESNNYAPLSNYYSSLQQQQHPKPQSSVSLAPSDRPVIRKNRGLGHSHDHHHHDHGHHHTTTYTYSSPFYLSSPQYYPESAVFSDPLPLVPLPQLPSEFLTLKSGSYGGSENEVPKKTTRGKKARKGKMTTTTTPAPVEEEEEEEDVQETEGEEEEATGGYPASRPRGRKQETEEATGGYPASGQQETEAEGGYPASRQQKRNRQETESSSGGYPASGQGSSQATEQGEGGYPSSFDANAEDNSNMQSLKAMSAGRSRLRSQSRRNRNRAQEEEDDDTIEDTEADQEGDDEIMMLSDDAEEEPEEEVRPRGRSRSNNKKNKGKGKGRSRGSSEDEDALNAALADQGHKIDTIYVPTFGNSVLNTVYPAYSQNLLLKSLEGQSGSDGWQSPESNMDISAISITADGDKKKSRKSKKRTSPRRSRPASRSSSRRSKNRQSSSARAAEPVEQPQQMNQDQSQAYGPPQFTPGAPTSEYGVPSNSQQQSSGSGLNPPPQSGNQGGYRTVNNEMRSQSNNNNQIQQSRSLPTQQYGVPANGAPRAALIEPRQISPATIVAAGNDQLSPVSGGNNADTDELIRTVQAILQRYPN